MHELSLALSIMDIVDKEVSKHKAKRATSAEVVVGELAGVDANALHTALKATAQHSQYPSMTFDIVFVEAVSECLSCGLRFHSPRLMSTCPKCKSWSCHNVQGEEFRVKSVVIELDTINSSTNR